MGILKTRSSLELDMKMTAYSQLRIVNSGHHHVIHKPPYFIPHPSLGKIFTLHAVSAKMQNLYREGLLLKSSGQTLHFLLPYFALSPAPCLAGS